MALPSNRHRWQTSLESLLAAIHRWRGSTKHFAKVAAAVWTGDGQLLVVRKRGADVYILPGGKPAAGETDLAALTRELQEELACTPIPGTVSWVGEFTDVSADDSRHEIVIRLYTVELEGSLTPSSEIVEYLWLNPSSHSSVPLAPSIRRKILPFYASHGPPSREAP
jgi:8-oxo-dGTP diphosphatase